MSRSKRFFHGLLALLREAFKREDLPPAPEETKRQYSISGWVRGEDGVYRNGGASISRRGKTWQRWNLAEGRDIAYPSLHAAIKEEVAPGTPALLLEGLAVDYRVDDPVDSGTYAEPE